MLELFQFLINAQKQLSAVI